jgi:hypothetical protein
MITTDVPPVVTRHDFYFHLGAFFLALVFDSVALLIAYELVGGSPGNEISLPIVVIASLSIGLGYTLYSLLRNSIKAYRMSQSRSSTQEEIDELP